jgi:hypothetical protein
MAIRITATAPTAYQLQSLRHFGMEIKKHLHGSYFSTQDFDTELEAKEYLKTRAEMYFDGCYDNDEVNLIEALDSIEKHGVLTLDAVTAGTEEVEIEKEEQYS